MSFWKRFPPGWFVFDGDEEDPVREHGDGEGDGSDGGGGDGGDGGEGDGGGDGGGEGGEGGDQVYFSPESDGDPMSFDSGLGGDGGGGFGGEGEGFSFDTSGFASDEGRIKPGRSSFARGLSSGTDFIEQMRQQEEQRRQEEERQKLEEERRQEEERRVKEQHDAEMNALLRQGAEAASTTQPLTDNIPVGGLIQPGKEDLAAIDRGNAAVAAGTARNATPEEIAAAQAGHPVGQPQPAAAAGGATVASPPAVAPTSVPPPQPSGAGRSSDGQSLSQQTQWTQQAFRTTYGAQADVVWAAQHEADLERNKRLYGSREPQAGTPGLAGTNAPPAPNRRIGATAPPGPGQRGAYGINWADEVAAAAPKPATPPGPTTVTSPSVLPGTKFTPGTRGPGGTVADIPPPGQPAESAGARAAPAAAPVAPAAAPAAAAPAPEAAPGGVYTPPQEPTAEAPAPPPADTDALTIEAADGSGRRQEVPRWYWDQQRAQEKSPWRVINAQSGAGRDWSGFTRRSSSPIMAPGSDISTPPEAPAAPAAAPTTGDARAEQENPTYVPPAYQPSDRPPGTAPTNVLPTDQPPGYAPNTVLSTDQEYPTVPAALLPGDQGYVPPATAAPGTPTPSAVPPPPSAGVSPDVAPSGTPSPGPAYTAPPPSPGPIQGPALPPAPTGSMEFPVSGSVYPQGPTPPTPEPSFPPVQGTPAPVQGPAVPGPTPPPVAPGPTLSPRQAGVQTDPRTGEVLNDLPPDEQMTPKFTGTAFDPNGTVREFQGATYQFATGRDANGLGVPGSSSYDCSSFVSAVWREEGIPLVAHTDAAYAQLQELGAQAIDLKDAKPGDLVFYMGAGYGGAISYHLAIYAGNGQTVDHTSVSVAGQKPGTAIRPIGWAGSNYTIIRDPRMNADRPASASTPPTIQESGAAESGNTTAQASNTVSTAAPMAATSTQTYPLPTSPREDVQLTTEQAIQNLDTSTPIDTILNLAGLNQGQSAQFSSGTVAEGMRQLSAGDPAGAWTEPYLNDVARLAWAREERTNGRTSDPRLTPTEYIEKWKDAFYGGDRNVALVDDLHNQIHGLPQGASRANLTQTQGAAQPAATAQAQPAGAPAAQGQPPAQPAAQTKPADLPPQLQGGKVVPDIEARPGTDPTDHLTTAWTQAYQQSGDRDFADAVAGLIVSEGGVAGGLGDNGQSSGIFQFYWGGGEGNGFQAWLSQKYGRPVDRSEAMQLAKNDSLALEYYLPKVRQYYDNGRAMGYTIPTQAIAAGGHNSGASRDAAVWRHYAEGWQAYQRGDYARSTTPQDTLPKVSLNGETTRQQFPPPNTEPIRPPPPLEGPLGPENEPLHQGEDSGGYRNPNVHTLPVYRYTSEDTDMYRQPIPGGAYNYPTRPEDIAPGAETPTLTTPPEQPSAAADERVQAAAQENLFSNNQPARQALMVEFQQKSPDERRAVFEDAMDRGLAEEGITDPGERERWKQGMRMLVIGEGLPAGKHGENPDLNPYMIAGENGGHPGTAKRLDSSALGYFQFLRQNTDGSLYTHDRYLPKEYKDQPFNPVAQVRQYVEAIKAGQHGGDPMGPVRQKIASPKGAWGP